MSIKNAEDTAEEKLIFCSRSVIPPNTYQSMSIKNAEDTAEEKTYRQIPGKAPETLLREIRTIS